MVIRILVVDDELALNTLIERILVREGYDVVCVTDGEMALALLAKDRNFGLVVTDLFMPKVDGIKILQSVKQNYPDLPVIISSTTYDSMIVKNLLNEGAAAFLSRPFVPKQLVEVVRKVLGTENSPKNRLD